MNNKMATSTFLSTIESIKQTKKQEQSHGYRERFDGCQMGGRCRGMSEDVKGLRSTDRQLQNSHVDIKCNIGNGVAKELTHMTHGHEQWRADCLREWAVLGGGGQRGLNWDNCNGIINKI